MTKRALVVAAYYAGLVNKLAEKKAQLAYRSPNRTMRKQARPNPNYVAPNTNTTATSPAPLSPRTLPQKAPAFQTAKQQGVPSMSYVAKPSAIGPGSPMASYSNNGGFATNIPSLKRRAPIVATAGGGFTGPGGGASPTSRVTVGPATQPPKPGSSYADPDANSGVVSERTVRNRVATPVTLPSGRSVAEGAKAPDKGPGKGYVSPGGASAKPAVLIPSNPATPPAAGSGVGHRLPPGTVAGGPGKGNPNVMGTSSQMAFGGTPGINKRKLGFGTQIA